MEDEQSGIYLHDSIIVKHQVAFLDWKKVVEEKGPETLNTMIIEMVDELKPDLTIIIKGGFIEPSTIRQAKQIHDHPIVGWIFDVTLGGTMVKDAPHYIELIKEFDRFYTIDLDAVPELEALGVKAKWLPEACCLPYHEEQVINFIQKKKFGEDVVFIGSVGGIHPNRTKFLEALHKEAIPFKIYGDILYEYDKDPVWVKDHHTGLAVINNYHSIVVGSSKIILGIDGWPDRSKSYSARLYRVMAAGGFYLTTHTKDIEKEFVPGVHLDTFKTEEEMIEKVIYYLNNEEARIKIAKAGQELVLAKHQFIHRIDGIINDIFI